MRDASGLGQLGLPTGGGGVAALGDRFQPDLVRGTGNYSVPLPCPKGPNDLQPSPALTYSTGSGNGPFGLGWRCQPLRIERRSDRGIPTYSPSDTFTLGGAELLVPVGGGRYRPRTETQFWHIEHLDDAGQDGGWRIRDGSGRTQLLGTSPMGRETGPSGEVFAWTLEEERDPAGNAIRYEYVRDGGRLYLAAIRWSIWGLEFHHEPRPDVLRNARAGFLRTTGLRVSAIDLSCSRADPSLLRTWSLDYSQGANGASQLRRVELAAGEGTARITHPALTFSYTGFDPMDARVDRVGAELPPPSLEAAGTQLVDLDGDGVPDVLELTASVARTWRNTGDGSLEGPFVLDGLPSTVSLARGNVALADLDGDGRADLFATDQALGMAFHADGRGGFDPSPTVFARRPTMRLSEAETRLTDLDGDGVTDLLWTGPQAFVGFRHVPGQGWQDGEVHQRVHDLEAFPDVRFGERGVRLADMTGDGLADIVVLRSGEVSYWPSLGSGSFGRRVDLPDPPLLPPGYRESSLHLVDLDGDGCADVVYVGDDGTTVWLNQSGNGFAPPVRLPIAPPPGRAAQPADIFGDGRPGLVWTSSSRTAGDSGYRVLRFSADRPAPYLLTTIDNGMGGLSRMAYTTSTSMRVSDVADGRPWSNRLPLVTHVVSSIEQVDGVSGRVSATRIRYHDGVYDGRNREFRGFRTVTVETGDSEESMPAGRQEIDFFQGDPDEIDLVERARQRSLAGSSTATAMYELVDGEWVLRQRSEQVWDARLERDDGPESTVWFPHVVSIDTRELSGGVGPDRIDRTEYTGFDTHGNPTGLVRTSFADGDPPADQLVTEERTTYLDDETAWLVRLPVRTTALDGDGLPFTVRVTRYDGPELVGLPEGAATAGLTTAVSEGRMFDARLPAGLLDGHDLTALGYHRVEAGAAGWYAVTASLRRDARGNVVEQRDPLGASTGVTFDADGVFPVSASDAAGRTTELTFEPRSGEPSLSRYPDQRVGRAEYDLLGRVVAVYEQDDTGAERLVKAWRTDTGSVPMSTTSYAPSVPVPDRASLLSADPMAAADAGTSVSRVFHDGFGNALVTVTTAPPAPGGPPRAAVTDRVVLNGRGLVATRLAPAFASDLSWPGVPTPAEITAASSQHTRYDATGVVVETIAPGGARFVVQRDAFTIVHREGGPAGDITRRERFDPRGRLIAVEEEVGDGTVAVARYDLAFDGRVQALRDGDDVEVARWDFAGPGEPLRISHRDAGTRSYLRDAARRLVELKDADGSVLRHEFDVLGRVVSIDAVGPPSEGPSAVTRVRTVTYDADPDPAHPSAGRFLGGRVAVLEEAGNTFRFSYDRAGRPVEEEQVVAGQSAAVRREYDLQGRPTALTYPDGVRVAYDLHSGGAVVGIDGYADELDYGPDGVLLSYRAANGMRVERPRDPDSGRLAAVRAIDAGGTMLRGLEYSYDRTGSITGLLDVGPSGTESSAFGYDGLHRLVSATVRAGGPAGPAIRSHDYRYDAAGNVQRYGDAAAADLVYGDAAHPGRVTEVTGPGGGSPRPVSYGPRGEVSATGSLAGIVLDAFGRMVSADSPASGGGGTANVRFAYDPQGRRVLKEVATSSGTTRTRYLAGLWEATETDAVRHVFLGTHLLASTRIPPAGPPTTLFHLCDHHGTVLASVDDACVMAAWQRYSPFGAALEAGQPLDRYLGREPDVELALLQLGARYYDPALGRFLAPDWYILEHPDKAVRLPQGFAVYAYALNNPLSFKDPSGLWFGIDDLIVLAVGFVVGFVTGLIYGLVNGQGWGSLLTALETGLTTAVGAWLGWTVGGPIGLVMGGMNGLIGGVHGIYDWSSPEGWFAFLSDSTWSLIGTSLGNVVHIINLFYKDANYRDDLSRRQNRNVYEGGFALKKDFAFTQGNVISNAGQGTGSVNASFIANHEELHVWQQRIFGPIFQITYVVWAVGGLIVGSIVWLWHTETGAAGWGSLVETAAYYDNPFEYWAYKNDNYWPPAGANPILTY